MSENFIPKSKIYTRNGEVVGDTMWPENMQRVALAIEYKGTDFHGFQTQSNGVKTVQQTLEKALSKVANEEITLICAGRTDAGVHATNQVITSIHWRNVRQRRGLWEQARICQILSALNGLKMSFQSSTHVLAR